MGVWLSLGGKESLLYEKIARLPEKYMKTRYKYLSLDSVLNLLITGKKTLQSRVLLLFFILICSM